MADATTYEDVAVPAERAWEVIGDFTDIRKWAPAVKDEKLEESPAGKVRILTMPDDSVVREALVLSSQFSYTYSVLDRPEMKDHRSTVAVVPLDGSSCRIELIVHVGASEGQTEEELTARYERFVRGNLKAMKKALGLA